MRSWIIPKTVFAALIAVPFAYPLVFLVVTALRSSDAYNRSPLGFTGFPTFGNITYAWNAGSLGHDALNSVLAVSIGVFTCCFASSLAAYWFLRHTGWFAKGLLSLLFIGWVAPFASYLVAFYVLLANHHLVDNLYMLGISYGAIFTPFGTFFILAYLRQALPADRPPVEPSGRHHVGRPDLRVALGRHHHLCRARRRRPEQIYDRSRNEHASGSDARGKRQRRHSDSRGRGIADRTLADA